MRYNTPSQKEINRINKLDEDRELLRTENEKDMHFINNIRDVIWDGKNYNRSCRLIKEGRLQYIHIPGVCGYVTGVY